MPDVNSDVAKIGSIECELKVNVVFDTTQAVADIDALISALQSIRDTFAKMVVRSVEKASHK